MLTKDPKTSAYTEAQVRFDSPSVWSSNYKKVIAEFLIARSQWEHIFELLCIDLKLVSGNDFAERLANADSFLKRTSNINEMKNGLRSRNNANCTSILNFLDELETHTDARHLVVHGFHHIYGENTLVARVNKDGARIEDEKPLMTELTQASIRINELVNEINKLRKQEFNIPEQYAFLGTTCTASTYEVSVGSAPKTLRRGNPSRA